MEGLAFFENGDIAVKPEQLMGVLPVFKGRPPPLDQPKALLFLG
jgi:hypothetical protein